ncbi:autotransporter domain-containing protein [Fusobacterium varium]
MDNTYTNNITLSSSEANGNDGNYDISYGLRLSGDLAGVNFINNGSIIGIGSNYGYGIYNDGGTITTLTNNGLISGSPYGIYNYGEITTLTNNGLIISDSDSGIYNYGEITTLTNNGLIISDSDSGIYNYGEITTLTNNGLISDSYYGVWNNSGTIETLTNNGLISGSGSGVWNNSGGTITMLTNNGLISGSGYGIYNDGGTIEILTNNGLISGYYYRIWNARGTIETLINNSLISGSDSGICNAGGRIETLTNNGLIISGSSSGIWNVGGTITTLTNNGLISGSYFGIYNAGGTITTLTNTGVIYGTTNAIKNDGGTIGTVNNYGIFVNGSDSDVENMGLIFKAVGGKYTATIEDYDHFGQTYEVEETINSITKKYTIINAKAIESEGDITGIDATTKEVNMTGSESLKLENGTLTCGDSSTIDISSSKGYILNGITDTLKVSGKHNELNDSIINAYETAVVMNGNMSMLTLNDSVVNGGISGKNTVKIEGDRNTLNIQGNSVINGKDTVITVAGNNNSVTLEGNAIVNGKMESTGTNNLISFNGNAGNGMNILHNISGFTNMNIENNVTFFEDVKVRGTEIVTVGKDGVLSLRLKKEADVDVLSNDVPKAVHAFSETKGTIIKGSSAEEAGTLNFITNGIGREIKVDMKNIELENMIIKASSIIDKAKIDGDYIHLGAGSDLSGIVNPKVSKYDSLDKIYKSLYSSTGENLDALRDILSMTYLGKNYDYNNANDEEQLKTLMSYLDSIYTGTPYSYSSELSRKSAGMFRDIITENQFRPDLNKWLVMGGLTHRDGGTKDSYYGKNYHGFDTGTADVDVDMKLTGAYALGKYGYSENVALGVTAGGNKGEAKLPMSKVKGNSGYIGAFAENYRGNLTLKAGAGIQYSEYDADRATLGGHSYSEKYSDMSYDIYLNGRYSHNIGNNLFLEPYGTLSYTYIKQDGADEGNKVLAIETDSKSFDYTTAKVGLDLKKVIPHEKGKSTLSAGISYTRLFNGADEENITGRFKGEDATDFDILVAHKNEHSIGLNAKYTLELENGILFDVKGSYSVERDSHNGSGKNKNKGEWIVGAGLGYKF